MTSFVLRTNDGDDAGFLGFAEHNGEWPPTGPIDCVFVPFGASDHPCATFVRDHAGREFTAEVVYDADTMRVDISLGPASRFVLRSSDDGNAWEVTAPDGRLSGTGRFL